MLALICTQAVVHCAHDGLYGRSQRFGDQRMAVFKVVKDLTGFCVLRYGRRSFKSTKGLRGPELHGAIGPQVHGPQILGPRLGPKCDA